MLSSLIEASFNEVGYLCVFSPSQRKATNIGFLHASPQRTARGFQNKNLAAFITMMGGRERIQQRQYWSKNFKEGPRT